MRAAMSRSLHQATPLSTDAVESGVAWCKERDIAARMLPVACAFHSPHVAGAQQELSEMLRAMELAVPQIAVYSNTTGDAHSPEPAAISGVLCEHLIQPVEF